MKTIKVKYRDYTYPAYGIKKIKIGDWIDLRCASQYPIEMKKGEFKYIPLGVAMELPKGYEAHIAPRSSTYKNFRIIQTNSVGVVDESYCGDDDYWMFPALAMEDTIIHFGDRICQFRIMKKMPKVRLQVVNQLGNKNRGGLGSTGVK